MTAIYGIVIGLALIVTLLGLLVIGLLRSHAEILRRLESLGAGLSGGHGQESNISLTVKQADGTQRPKQIEGITPQGEPVLMSPTLGADPTLLAFLSTSCASCTVFWEGLDSSSLYFGDQRHRVLIVIRAENEESPTRAISLSRGNSDVVMSPTAWDDYGVPGAPYFVVVDPTTGGIIGEGSAPSFDALEEFLTDASNDRRWDDERRASIEDEETRVDSDLRDAGLLPGDPRLYPKKGDLPMDDSP